MTVVSALALCACGALGLDSSETTVVLVDVSASIPDADRKLRQDVLDSAVGSFSAGDRLVVATIGGPRSNFYAVVDEHVERTGIDLDDEDAAAAAVGRISEQITTLIDNATPTTETRLIEGIVAGTAAFRGASGPKRLILLTDGIEESHLLNLGRPMEASRLEAALNEARASDLVPSLAGVDVHVIGAGGEHYVTAERWWRMYFVSAGANLVSYDRLARSAVQ